MQILFRVVALFCTALILLVIFNARIISSFILGFGNRIQKVISIKKYSFILLVTLIFMLVAYAFAYANGMFLYDASFLTHDFNISFSSDKWFNSIVYLLDMGVYAPWLAGLYAIFFLSVSIYFITDVLNINKNSSLVLVTGLCATNSAIMAQQQFTGGVYTGEVALFFASMGAWIETKSTSNKYIKHILSVLFIMFSAGVYASYTSVASTLMILVLVMEAYENIDSVKIFRDAVAYGMVFVTAVLLHFSIIRVGMNFTNSNLQDYMGESSLQKNDVIIKMALSIPKAYVSMIKYYICGDANGFIPKYMAIILSVMFWCGIIITIRAFWNIREQISIYNFALLFLFIMIMPLSLNFIDICSQGRTHFLMTFTYVLPFVFFVKVVEVVVMTNKSAKSTGYCFALVTCFFIIQSIILCNAALSRYYFMYVEAQSVGTRILDRIENVEGFEGNERIIIVGGLKLDDYYGPVGIAEAEVLNAKIGPANPQSKTALDAASWIMRFLSNVLGSDSEYTKYINMDGCIESEDFSQEEIEQIKRMNDYPRNNSVIKIEDTIVVKFKDEI
ncbi:glucosyltransferase domain-containing protein [Butyrivibrio sp. INlla16]|uniref:glucosyltransferase domain-containing protein n=1 Tax=Butyrivibrio sp. INlla16 TaxID=1520807 RepID=UPI0008919928|nr:glucosyltransferase domain-containing protein [Butyrivibrio sp. INlla16]SDB68225.1 Glucosyl transferase GtrII [Butyrivibrio sp. INlla16]